MTELTVRFAVASEAERALTQLRAAGVPDDDVRIHSDAGEGVDRDDEVGVPDSAASFAGLSGGDGPAEPAAIIMTVELARARITRDEVLAVLHAAGGRTDS